MKRVNSKPLGRFSRISSEAISKATDLAHRKIDRKAASKWIALDAEGTSIIASAESLSVLEDDLVAAGEDPQEVILDRIEDDDALLGPRPPDAIWRCWCRS